MRSGKNPFLILELQGTSRLEVASGVMTHQGMHGCSITRKLLNTSATQTGKAAGAMTCRLLTRFFCMNDMEIKQKSLEALRHLRRADQALEEIRKSIADCTEYVCVLTCLPARGGRF
jgi:hypothetical protein